MVRRNPWNLVFKHNKIHVLSKKKKINIETSKSEQTAELQGKRTLPEQ